MIDINQAISSLSWQREPYGLYAPIAYALEGGGKRLRPTLALMACRMFGGDEEKALPVALALEIFHNFTLLHDDVMDQAPVRRGRPTVHVRWDDNTAILSGDQMMTEAYVQLEQVSPSLLPRVLHLFNAMATDIWRGQQLDMEFEKREKVSVDEYIEMVRLKTSVLLGAALQLGGLMAGASESDLTLLYRIGERIGLAFQIQDDVLDVWGDERTFGKRIGGDIVQNKKSLVQILALENAHPEQLRELRRWIDMKCFDEEQKIAEVTALYNAIRVRPMCEEREAQYTEQAMNDIMLLSVPQDKKQELIDITRKLLNRKN